MKNMMKMGSIGFQHVLAMYAGAVVVPLIVGGQLGLTEQELTYLVSIDLLMCGIATILQVMSNRFFGIGLPVVLGCTFTAVAPMISIGSDFGISSIYGAIIAAGLFVLIGAPIFGRLVRFFPPVVTGSVVTIIGITLIPVAMDNMAGGAGSENYGAASNLLLAFGVLILIVFLQRAFKGFIRAVSILIGLVVGTVVAAFMGKVDFSPLTSSDWFHMPQPFYFGTPTFEVAPVITMILVAMVSIVESTGVYFALSDICDRDLSQKELTNGYRAEGLAIFFGGLMNAFPYTTYSQNVGLVQLSGVKSRNVIYLAGAMLITIGLVPKIGAITTLIPAPVLGGAMVPMFGMVVAYGIKMLGNVDLKEQENLLIIACSVGMGLGVTVAPDLFAQLPKQVQILTDNGIVAGSITAILLNLFMNILPQKFRKQETSSSQSIAS
ncbi:nucleobase:cation symporter-2 family protein [Pontibacillus marinus]|uniref:Xanthine permease n=1 Tax=Pontibacillus marinus BH030004 = DSM 16465 TaxID=1385511 RepID=A0A0A5G595_9BACI|nr:nucleobase:cation symporter-2 family protein [Pontibacillus marinus]KGX86260.1 xanthine permease [Pontibacillus marinus BH030004 = DSM 16465]